MTSETMNQAAAQAAQAAATGRDDLAALKGDALGHAKAMFRTPDRPTAITVIAWICAVGTVMTILGGISTLAAGLPLLGAYLLVLGVVAAVCTLGFFGMRKWAVWVYGAQVAFTVVTMIFSQFNVLGLVLPAIVLALCVKHYSKMK